MPDTTPDELRFLSQADAIEAGAANMSGCVDQMERVFDLYDSDRVLMGGPEQFLHGHMTTFPGDLSADEAKTLRSGSRFGAMPAYVGGEIDTVGVKWYGSVTLRVDRDRPAPIAAAPRVERSRDRTARGRHGRLDREYDADRRDGGIGCLTPPRRPRSDGIDYRTRTSGASVCARSRRRVGFAR